MNNIFIDSIETNFVIYSKFEIINEKMYDADDECKVVKYIDIFNQERYAVLHNKTHLLLYRDEIYYSTVSALEGYSITKALNEYLYCNFHLKHNLGTRRFCSIGEYIINANEIIQIPYMVIFNHELTFHKVVLDNKFLELFNAIDASKREKISHDIVDYNGNQYKAYKFPKLSAFGMYKYFISIQENPDGTIKTEDFFVKNSMVQYVEKDSYNEDEVYEGIGSNYLDLYIEHNIFKETVEYHKAFGYFKYYTPLSALILLTDINLSQYKYGIWIEERFLDIYNPPGTYFYVKRGRSRKIKILFNGKTFNSSYIYENQKDTTHVLQRVSFKKDFRDEFIKIFPNLKGKLIVQQGIDANHYVFMPVTEYLDGMENEKNKILEERDYQQNVETTIIKGEVTVDDKPEERPKSKETNGSRRWARDAKKSKSAIILAKFCCEVDKEHKYFTSNVTKTNYVEAHHLIPIELQDHFDVNIDIGANIVSLCPVCHVKLHHAIFQEEKEILIKLFNDRIKRLQSCGIKLQLEELLNLYGKS